MIKILELNVFDYNVELKDYISKKDYFCELIQMDLIIKNDFKQNIFSIDDIYSFEFNLCDLKGFEKEILNKDEDFLKMKICGIKNYNLLITKKYSYDLLLDYLNTIFSRALKQSNDPTTIAKIIHRYLNWIDYSYF